MTGVSADGRNLESLYTTNPCTPCDCKQSYTAKSHTFDHCPKPSIWLVGLCDAIVGYVREAQVGWH